ncbi:MAG: pectate lyase, partial [Planctomycetota bacterium]
MRQRTHLVVCAGVVFLLACSAAASETALKEQAAGAMRRAAEFFRTRVSTEGGYLWRYSEDLSLREGEGTATDTMIWVQP